MKLLIEKDMNWMIVIYYLWLRVIPRAFNILVALCESFCCAVVELNESLCRGILFARNESLCRCTITSSHWFSRNVSRGHTALSSLLGLNNLLALLNMEGSSPTRGSPSKQLTAFNPMGYDAFAHRANPGSLPGMATIRPTSDPFAGWIDEKGSAPSIPSSQTTTASSASCYAYPVPATTDHANTRISGNEYKYSPVSPRVTCTQAARASIGKFQPSPVSPQVSPAGAGPGGMLYSPSHAQASRSLNQTQYSPHSLTRAQARLASEYSPVQAGIANVRYSPSRDDINYEYNPTPDFLSRLLAAADSAVGDTNVASPTNALAHISPSNQARRATGTTDASPRSPAAGTNDVVEKHRSFIVQHVPLDTPHRSIVMMFPIEEYPSLETVCLKHLEARGVFSFSFGDLREAVHAMNKIRLTRPSWRVFPASYDDIATFNGSNGAVSSVSVPQGGAFLLDVYTIPSKWLVEPVEEIVNQVVASLGTLCSCKPTENGTSMSRYQVEYFNKRHAAYAFSCLGGFRLDSLHFNVSIDAREEVPVLPRYRTASFGSPRSPVTPYHLVSKENEIDEKVDISPVSDEGQTSGEHAIDLDRIKQGLDVRSTVMIRNIPNKITSDQLKTILDESSHGKYDFLYLRMDFTHHCNVGYAFMNFADAIDIVNLVHAREGKAWPDCISEKIAQVSYATLQGREALVNKFRNSNVMTRPHEERPRLFHVDGPRAGTEATFPGPNDASKLRRSVASTTQQGLYSPRKRAPSTPRSNRTRPQSGSFNQTPRSQLLNQTPRSRPSSIRTPRQSGGRSVQHGPGEFSPMKSSPLKAEDRQVKPEKN
ncbi:hypothetical protein CBS147332_8684 [Penicillium roqueforti]|nr:hypothetical protein CBS147332_8684 [Penicillium roqueforti]KAI3097018.1 hypothetical protein CBS147331_9066 [Penicillium roqueforti]